jgi:hypothetical protein
VVKLDETLTKLYYDPKGARDALGISLEKFNYWVELGIIESVTLPQLKHRVFSRSHIDALGRHLEALLLAAAKEHEEFRVATVVDLAKENELALINFGSGPNTAANNVARRAFIEKNPEITYHLYDSGLLVAAINIVPLKHHCLAEFREGKRGWLFSPHDIEQFEPGHPLELIIINFMTSPSVPSIRRSGYAVRMLSELANVFEAWGERGVEIASIHASGGTPAGRRILESAGFQLLGAKSETRVIYYLDVMSSELKLLQGYKQGLKRYKEKQQA